MKRLKGEVTSPNLAAATVTVFCTTFSLLFFQILQSVTLSLQIFHNTAFLAISLCMFGLGAGGSIAFFLENRGPVVTQRTLWCVSMAYACSLLAAGMLSSRVNHPEGHILTGFRRDCLS